MDQNRAPRRPLPKQKPYVPEYVRWNKQPILMDRSGRVVEPQSGSSQRVVHIPPGRENPQEQARTGATQRVQDNQEQYFDPYGTWPSNLQRQVPRAPLPPQTQVPYSTGAEDHHWTMNGAPIQDDDEVMIDADQYSVPPQTYVDPAQPPPSDDTQTSPVHETDEEYSAPPEPHGDFVAPGGYLLLIKGKIIARGDIDLMNEIVSDIIYERHPDFKNVSLDPDDFVVLKRMKLRVGVSIE